MRVVSLHLYPVKSCRGEDLDESVVEPWGLAGDRRWMVVDAGGSDAASFVSARLAPDLLLVTPGPVPGGVVLTPPPGSGVGPLTVAEPHAGQQRDVVVWGSRATARDAGDRAAVWLAAVLAPSRRAPAHPRLVWMDDPRARPADPRYADPGDVVSFADGYPLLLTTLASLAALDDDVLAATDLGGEPLSMTRFRPNVVVDGTTPWAEDDWRRVRIGGPDGVGFRAVKACARCVMTTLDPDTAEPGREPLAALGRIRRVDGGLWFGVNLVPEPAHAGRVVRRGDVVEVLDAVAPGSGPLH